MKVCATLLIRDEEDVLAAFLEHTFAQGVDVIVVTDNGSCDRSIDILRSYEATGRVHVIHEPGDDYRQGEWVTAMAKVAHDLDADWVLHLDADEFVFPVDGSATVRESLGKVPLETTVIRSRRRNLRRGPGDDRPWPEALRWLEKMSFSERGTPLGLKAAHRPDPEAIVAMGNHSVTGPRLGEPDDSQRLEYLHVPDRSWEHYSGKIRTGGAAVARNSSLDPNQAWHWRRDYERLLDGSLEEVYRARQLSRWALVRGLLTRKLTRDNRVGNELRDLGSNAISPVELAWCLAGGRRPTP